MQIGIIGAGRIGAFLAKSFTQLGHSVRISNSRGPETLKQVESETGATALPVAEVVKNAQLIILTIPTKGVFQLDRQLFESALENVVIVDTCNYNPSRDGPIEEIQNGKLNHTEWISHYFNRPMIKAFNNITDFSLKSKGGIQNAPNRVAIPVSGDSLKSKQLVSNIIEDLGFDAVDIGSLADSWKQQMGGPMYCNDLNREELEIAVQIANRSVMEEQYLEIFKQLYEFSNEYVEKNNLDISGSNAVLYVMEMGDAQVHNEFIRIFRKSFTNLQK
ncbi:predicted protein [Naegleria gruberi]|uniref:Predicted protein n=1 Tax=Naegleria gruberi TaxID=5762 RepID=D2W1A3_NAEGR|nr:uncharacterized protein NAEGRDRAFT_75146 [Naegleria gruberi]EFC37193.1 predicted protein [Naegleria gruberi]|eukprot:XP_002669937.1 predicted protein [Naegleria gruberi strain NEG-M]